MAQTEGIERYRIIARGRKVSIRDGHQAAQLYDGADSCHAATNLASRRNHRLIESIDSVRHLTGQRYTFAPDAHTSRERDADRSTLGERSTESVVELCSHELVRRFLAWKRSVFRKVSVPSPPSRGRGQALKKRWSEDEMRRHS